MTVAGLLYLLGIIAGAWETFQTRSPGWGAVTLIAGGLFASTL
jgi:hypothetical protein